MRTFLRYLHFVVNKLHIDEVDHHHDIFVEFAI